MSQVVNCALCLEPGVSLCLSHIIPEFCYKKIYTSTHKFVPIQVDNCSLHKIQQKGFREYLLCQACETKLSQWENVLSRFFNDLITHNTHTLSIKSYGGTDLVTNIDYDATKKSVLSILWRMSISKLPYFAGYDLGPHNEIIRHILDQNFAIVDRNYPILITKGLIGGRFLPGMLTSITRGRHANKTIIQSVVLNGFVFDIHITHSETISKPIESHNLQSVGSIKIPHIDFDDLGISFDEIQYRMMKDDVKAFYARHHK